MSEERKTEHIRCNECGQSVSSPTPKGTTIRAYVLCPECLEMIPEEIANEFFEQAKNRQRSLGNSFATHHIGPDGQAFTLFWSGTKDSQ
jgi:formylmethanofuran dehydrogenase subunit E